MERCIICKKDFTDIKPVSVGRKDLNTLLRACSDRGLDDKAR